MGFMDAFRSMFRAVTVPAVGGRVSASNSADIPENDPYWRRLGSSSRTSRDLAEVDFKRMVRECAKAAKVDGMARAHVRLVKSITVGAGEVYPRVEGGSEESRKIVDAALRKFWCAPGNDLQYSLEEFMAGLCATGNLALTLSTGETSKLTRVGYLDPETFVDPFVLRESEDARSEVAILREGAADGVCIAHPVIRADGSVAEIFDRRKKGSDVVLGIGGELRKFVVGAECVYLGVNRETPDQAAGISDLYASLDVLTLLDELVFSAAQRSLNIGTYSLHVKFPRGTDKKAIDERMLAIRADIESGRGRAVGTTEDVTISAVSAALNSGEWATMESMVRTSALIGLGPWPVHIFSEGAGTNVTAAAEQGSAVANFLLGRQNAFKRLMLRLATVAVRRYPEARAAMDADPTLRIVLPLPTIVARNTTRESNVLAVEMNTLAAAEDRGYITSEAAQREAVDAMARYGFDVGPGDCPSPEELRALRDRASLAPRAFEVPGDPNEDPRGGHREGEGAKTSDGTPAKASRRAKKA